MLTRRHRTFLVASVVGALLAGGLVTAHGAGAAAGCRVGYAISGQWPGGFGADVTVTNLGDPIDGWRLVWTFGAGQAVTQAWNATVSQSGGTVTATNLGYNATVATNAAVKFGFNGSWAAGNPVPAAFALNGVTCTGVVTGPSASPSSASRCAGPASPAPAGPELVYVANRAGAVTAYPAGSLGAVAPVRRLADPQLPLATWSPWGVAFDAARNLYVQSFLSNATTFVYAPGAGLPCRVFAAGRTDSKAVAVDPAGYEYIVGGEVEQVIAVAAPGASGTPSGYRVPALREIELEWGYQWPSVLTTDTSGHVIAAVPGSNGNALVFYTGGPSSADGSAPVRVITGPHTGLGTCSNPCNPVVVSYSPFDNRLYVAVSQDQQTHISVYAANASGDAAAVQVITGPSTGLAGMEVTGIATSQVDGSIYVLARPDALHSTPGTVLVYDRLANGNAAPARSFTDASTGLSDGMGIAIGR